jgi:ribokinase
MKFDIVTFGSGVVDVFVSTDIAEKGDFFNYPLGEKILIKNMQFDIGGGGTNTAVAFSRLGFKTGCICKTGKDYNGDLIKKRLKKEKVAILCQKTDGKTGYSVILDSKKKDRTILTFKGANDEVIMRDLPKFTTSWIYLTSMLEESLDTQKQLVSQLIKTGTKVAFNPSSYLIINADISKLLKLTSVLVVNKEEAHLLCSRYLGSSNIESITDLGPEVVAITDGENKVVCYTEKKKYTAMPPRVKVHELTGAGDAFAAGFVAGVMLDWSIPKCIQLGFKESARVITSMGAKQNLLKLKLKRH